MNRNLLIGLAVVAGLSAYVSMQSDDESLVAGKQSARSGRPREAARNDEAPRDRKAGRAVGRGPASVASKENWVSAALVSGVNQWQSRLVSSDDGQLAKPDLQAWHSMQPPPPPPPPKVVVVEAPPPPPMAPRFPHAWVGRFNDEAPAAAASGASGAAAPPTQRAVLAGNDSTWVVRAGDVIEGQWRVDRIQDRTMSLTYLPLMQQQTVVMR
ncbi:MAG: hypothetical protein QM749_10650 [Aquabacterium sp.]